MEGRQPNDFGVRFFFEGRVKNFLVGEALKFEVSFKVFAEKLQTIMEIMEKTLEKRNFYRKPSYVARDMCAK